MNNPNGTTTDSEGGQQGAGVDQLKDSVRDLRDRAGEVKEKVMTRSNRMVDRATTYIRHRPLMSVGIAFGVGYLGMRLFRR